MATLALGAGAVTDVAVTIGTRTDAPGDVVQILYSPDPNWIGAALTPGVVTQAADDNTCREEITDLEPDTVYFYDQVVNGTPTGITKQVRTFPEIGVDAPFSIAFGSCIKFLTPTLPMWASIRGKGPRLMIINGDRVYADSADLAVMRAKLRALYEHAGFRDALVHTTPELDLIDDHELLNNANGSTAGWAAVRQAYGEYGVHYPCPNPGVTLEQECRIGNVHVIGLDTREQRASSKPLYPSATYNGDGWGVAQAGTTSTQIVVPPKVTGADINNITSKTYIEIENVGVWRAQSWTYSTRTLVPREPIPGMAPGVRFKTKDASMLDKDGGANSQTERLIATCNASPHRWILLVTSVPMNVTAGAFSESWKGFDALMMELRYIAQRLPLAVRRRILIIAGDRHCFWLDDGAHSGLIDIPEVLSSALDQDTLSVGSVLASNGSKTGKKNFGLVEIGVDPHTLTVTGWDENGIALGGITPLVLQSV